MKFLCIFCTAGLLDLQPPDESMIEPFKSLFPVTGVVTKGLIDRVLSLFELTGDKNEVFSQLQIMQEELVSEHKKLRAAEFASVGAALKAMVSSEDLVFGHHDHALEADMERTLQELRPDSEEPGFDEYGPVSEPRRSSVPVDISISDSAVDINMSFADSMM